MGPWRVTVLLATVVLTAVPAAAQQVGTATAVNPLSESTPPGATTAALTVGSHIVHKERIHTTPSGTVQLLFLDKSTLSIAPNTNLLIDEYVYDPSADSGHMLVSLTEGALRFVGGKLSHQGEATVATPAAAIGIRGGTATVVNGKNGTRVIDQYGVITIHNGAGTTVIDRPGFVVTILNWNTPPGEPERVTEAEIAHFLQILTSGPGQNGGVGGLHNVLIGECGSGPAQPGVGALHGNNCPGTPWVPTDTGESDAFQLIIQATQRGTGQTQQHGRFSH
jgi:hypothetical protein